MIHRRLNITSGVSSYNPKRDEEHPHLTWDIAPRSLVFLGFSLVVQSYIKCIFWFNEKRLYAQLLIVLHYFLPLIRSFQWRGDCGAVF